MKDHYRIADPGFTLGGDLIKDRLWVFARHGAGIQSTAAHRELRAISGRSGRADLQRQQQHLLFVRRAWISWPRRRSACSARGRTTMRAAPAPRCRARTIIHGQFNSSSTNNPDNYNGGIGSRSSATSSTTSGADITLTPSLIATTRFGYFYYNYRETAACRWASGTSTATPTTPTAPANAPALATTKALNGTAAALAVREFDWL